MNFEVRKKDILDCLNMAARAISSTTPLPSLNGIKFVIEDNCLYLISSDSNISIKSCIKNDEKEIIKIYEEGGIVIDTKYILEIVRKIDSEFVKFEILDGALIKIYGGNSEYKINGMDVKEYPSIDFDIKNDTFKLKCTDFFNIINQTAFACSDSETRPILTGVNFIADGGKLTVNATDSYRLAIKTIDIDENLNFNITIPSKYLMDVYHSVASEEKIEIAIDNQKISFIFNNTIIQTRLLDDVFPDTSKLIPSSFAQILKLSAKTFLNAIDRTSFIKSDGKHIVKLSINSQNVIITSSNQVGSSYEIIDVISFEGEPFDISCSGKYLIDAIKAIDAQEITISFSGEIRPMIITNNDDSSIIQLISPVRTYK